MLRPAIVLSWVMQNTKRGYIKEFERNKRVSEPIHRYKTTVLGSRGLEYLN
jgi:hypothetical protein